MRHLNLFMLVLGIAMNFSFAQSQDYTSLVNPFIGTGGHGHTYPGATAPFGFVQLSPDTRLTGWDGCSGYYYTDTIIYGFSHTHLSGTGVSDYGDVLLMPTIGKPVYLNSEYTSSFRKSTESAEPGYYTVYLVKPDVKVELTATQHVGYHRYTFPESKEANMLLDLQHRDEVLDSWIEVISDTEIHGYRLSKAWAQKQPVYFVMQFSKPFEAASVMNDGKIVSELISFTEDKTNQRISGKSLKCNFRFSTQSNEQIVVKVALSAVSIDGALANMNAEAKSRDFDTIRNQTKSDWNRELGKIEVSGGSHSQQVVFYTALYHCMVVPNVFMDADSEYLGMDLKPHKAKDFTPYTVFSLWDTYRAYHPLMTIIDTHRTTDFINTFLADYRNGGLLPVWELSANETFCMIGYHSVPVIADACMKGIRGFDAGLALEAMIHSATSDHFGLDVYRTHGCIPGDMEPESVSKTLEYAYDDWCIAQMAKQLNDSNTYHEYIQRAQYYRNIFDPQTGFMRPRINGGWKQPFNPAEVDFNFTEANSWQYSFYVPQDITGLARLQGGNGRLSQKLDELFTTQQNVSGREQVDISGLIGQYAHGNEPSHHMAYLYTYLGEPWKTQQRVRQIMDEMYTDKPDGLIGNEDCGQMSAWLIMSAMGFYPVCPGSNQYAIGTPWFPSVIIHLENGKTFTIKAQNLSQQNFYIQSAALNGQSYGKCYLEHADIMKGGELAFIMGPEPDKSWGTGTGNQPSTEITDNSMITIPYLDAGSQTFSDSITVSVKYTEAGSAIYYTLDGNEPDENSIPYNLPITLHNSGTIKAVAIVPGKGKSFVVEGSYTRVTTNYTIFIKSKVDPQYTAGGSQALIDGIRGAKNFRLGGWQGYQGQDFEAVVDLGSVKPIHKLWAGFLQDMGAWIMMPRMVEFLTSNDGKTFNFTALINNTVADTITGSVTQDLKTQVNLSARYVKIIALSYGPLPEWHSGAGNPSYIFIDEIGIE